MRLHPAQQRLSRRPIILAGFFLLTLALALLLGHWLAVAKAPLSRHAIAQNLLESGDPDKAAYVFETAIWQGVALYRAGRYHRAVGAFIADDSVTGLYNMGNAYAHLGLYRGAITAYEAVLRRRPTHEDALFNLNLVRAAAKRQQELEDESRAAENAGNWEDGQRESGERGELETTISERSSASEDAEAFEPEDDAAGDQNTSTDASETSAPESEMAGEQAGGSEKEDEQADASAFSLSEQDQRGSDDLSAEGAVPEDVEVMGGLIDRAREQAMADEIMLRRIKDDPASVLKARLNMALRKRRATR